MRALGMGIVGFGRIGAEHAGWMNGPRVRAVAAADATGARLEMARERGLRGYSTLEELLGDADVEAVLIATPTAMHFAQAMGALAVGKHVMVEKPMAMNAREARERAAAARERGLMLGVFHNRRWDADFLAVCAAVRRGVFGKIINIESRLGQWASCVGPAAREYRPGWRNEARFGGGGLFDWGSHFLDQLRILMLPAKPVRVFAQLRGNVWSSDCDDFARVCVDFDNGTAGMVEINTTTTQPLPRWHIDGTAGSASSPFSLAFDVATWAKLDFSPADGSGPRPLGGGEKGLGENEIWDRFARATRGEGEAAATGESALGTMALLDAARESAANGVVVEVVE